MSINVDQVQHHQMAAVNGTVRSSTPQQGTQTRQVVQSPLYSEIGQEVHSSNTAVNERFMTPTRVDRGTMERQQWSGGKVENRVWATLPYVE